MRQVSCADGGSIGKPFVSKSTLDRFLLGFGAVHGWGRSFSTSLSPVCQSSSSSINDAVPFGSKGLAYAPSPRQTARLTVRVWGQQKDPCLIC